MRRPILCITMFYVLGMIIQYRLSMSYRLISYSLFVMMIFTIIEILLKRKSMDKFLLCMLLLLGALVFKINNDYQGQLVKFYNSEVYMIGDVLDASYKNTIQLTVRIQDILKGEKHYKVKDKILIYLDGETEEFEKIVGKKIGIHGILQKPLGRRNPKTFDYQLYLKTKKIYTIAYVPADRIKIIGAGDFSILFKMTNAIRNHMMTIVCHSLPQKEGGLLLGILLGDKDRLDVSQYEIFKEVGIAHILAVSGLHVGIIYMFLNKLLKRFTLKIKAPIFLMIFCFYAMLTGYSPSVLRATAMAAILILAPLLDRRYDSLSAISVVALILLIIHPILFMNIGFQLSFISVLSITLFYKPILKKLEKIPEFFSEMLAASLAAQIGIIPVIAYHFNYISLGAFLANIPVVLLIGYVVPLGLLTIILGCIHLNFAIIFSCLNFYLIRLIVIISSFIYKIPFSSIPVVSPSFISLIVYYSLFLIWRMEEGRFQKHWIDKKTVSMIILAAYVLSIGVFHFPSNQLQITFIDVGQGDSIFIQTPRRNILIDTGGTHEGAKRPRDIGKEILVPYFLKNRIKKIDIMMLSHEHRDHIGGAMSVLNNIKVNALVIGTGKYETEDFKKIEEQCLRKKIKLYSLSKGSRIKIEDQVYMDILHPDKHLITSSRDDTNNNSLVVLMNYGDNKLLFTGDIEEEAEKMIIEQYPDLKVDILKVPHHGSRYSSSDDFIKRLSPKIAIVQVGKNRFGHPDPVILKKFRENHISVFRNDENGAIILSIHKDKTNVKTMVVP